METKVCSACGHPQEAHAHYRRGSDCGVCGVAVCPRFQPGRPVVLRLLLPRRWTESR